jgi:purine-binding chemotaxis protein CheW
MSLYLIARIAEETIALNASQIGSVVEIDAINPVPRVPRHVAGLFALRSRVLTVIDTSAALGLGMVGRDGTLNAVIVESEGHSYALLVEQVEDVIEAPEPDPCPALLGLAWRTAALGTIRRGDEAILLIDPAALIAGAERVAA